MQNTIAILSDKRPEGWVLINEEDFDPAVHMASDPAVHKASDPAVHTTADSAAPVSKINGQQVIHDEPEPEVEPEPIETPEIPINEPQVRKPGRPRK